MKPGSTIADHLADWRQLWALAKAVARLHYEPHGEFATPDKREAFEFARTALVYHRNALDAFMPPGFTPADEQRFHYAMRTPGRRSTNNALLHLPDDPIFRNFTDPGTDAYKATGGPHFASAAVRVAVGVLAAIRINKATFPYTQPLKSGEIDWDRDSAAGDFGPAKKLGHCANGVLSNAHAAVLVLVHRDNFGHGEVGAGKAYRSGREEVLDETPWCRLLEAQRVLIRWCLDEFKV